MCGGGWERLPETRKSEGRTELRLVSGSTVVEKCERERGFAAGAERMTQREGKWGSTFPKTQTPTQGQTFEEGEREKTDQGSLGHLSVCPSLACVSSRLHFRVHSHFQT